jgi:hypothetical protein
MSHPRPTGPAGDDANDGRSASSRTFDALLAEVMAHTDRLGHRQHIHLTRLAVRRYGVGAAVTMVSDGIRRTARYAGAPQKYHATVSRAWVELVGHHLAAGGDDDFDAFADRYPALLDKRLLGHHYRSTTLATAEARSGWVEPDLKPLPQPTKPAANGTHLLCDGPSVETELVALDVLHHEA